MQAAVRRFFPVPAGGISRPECRELGCIYNPPIDTVLHDSPCRATGPVLGEDMGCLSGALSLRSLFPARHLPFDWA
ncbi:uncharacterized protein PpBr36_10565 [Pyricularia pennisetigena]|uniref:uncharacterized protein n=1 Tax=Pyricularia pennisetigena TaxID=1578925 RepID=UPI00114D692C|nr:uncharacterized protein PpBr36_10565 [Pyricularia pennisetigena]TLS21216.1 hypothetical protein PpBr36_10565 [Pyricularia pennisetigena]